MPRRRLGAALLFVEPIRSELIGLRRAIGCPSIDRMDPHVTVLAPVNVREDDLVIALAVMRRAATSIAPFEVELIGAATFAPRSPVLFLGVEGPDRDRIDSLRGAIARPPLLRSTDHEFFPHVTLHEDADDDVIAAGLVAFAHYRRAVTLGRVALLQQRHEGKSWYPIGEWELGQGGVRGRGGFEVTLHWATVPGPDAVARLDEVGADRSGRPTVDGSELRVVEAMCDGVLAGVVEVATADEQWSLGRMWVRVDQRGAGIGSHLAFTVARAGWVNVASTGQGVRSVLGDRRSRRGRSPRAAIAREAAGPKDRFRPVGRRPS